MRIGFDEIGIDSRIGTVSVSELLDNKSNTAKLESLVQKVDSLELRKTLLEIQKIYIQKCDEPNRDEQELDQIEKLQDLLRARIPDTKKVPEIVFDDSRSTPEPLPRETRNTEASLNVTNKLKEIYDNLAQSDPGRGMGFGQIDTALAEARALLSTESNPDVVATVRAQVEKIKDKILNDARTVERNAGLGSSPAKSKEIAGELSAMANKLVALESFLRDSEPQPIERAA